MATILTKDVHIVAMVTRLINLELDQQIAQGEIEYWRARIAVIDHYIHQQLMEIEPYE